MHQKIRHDGMSNFAVSLTVETELWYYIEAPCEEDAIDEIEAIYKLYDGSTGYEDSATDWHRTQVDAQAHVMEQY